MPVPAAAFFIFFRRKEMKKRIIGSVSAAVLALTGISGDLMLPFAAEVDHSYRDENGSEYGYNNDWSWIKVGDHIRLFTYLGQEEDIYLPDQLSGLPVTETDSKVFTCSSVVIKSLHIPATLTDLGGALGECSDLAAIEIDEANTSFVCENNAVYTSDGSVLLRCLTGAEGDFAIPGTVATVEENAFNNCTELKSVSVPASVEDMKDTLFNKCSSLKSIDVAEDNNRYSSRDGVLLDAAGEKLYKYPVQNANTEWSIPDGVREIEAQAFQSADGLERIGIPSSVETIGDSSFRFCSKLNNVVIPDSVAVIGQNAFDSCAALSDITFSEKTYKVCAGAVTVTPWYEKQPEGPVYTGSVLYAFKGAVPENYSLTVREGTVGITEAVFSATNGIYADIFYGCTDCINLVSVTLPDGIRYIGDDAFWGCCGLKEINLPDSLESIGERAFFNCRLLEKIHIPMSLDELPEYVFYCCDAVTDIVIPSNIKSVGQSALASCYSLKSVTFENPHCIIDEPFWHESAEGDALMFSGAIYGYTGSTAQSYAGIYGYKFISVGEDRGSSSGSSEHETDGLWEWSRYDDHICLEAYNGDGEAMELPDSIDGLPVTEAAEDMYIKAPDVIKSVKIPANMTRLGNIFTQLGNVSEIEADKGSKAYVSEDNALYTADRKRLIRCCTDKVKGELTLPDTVTEADDNAFLNCTELKKVNIPAAYKGALLFEGCTSLEAVSVADENSVYSSVGGVLFNKRQTSLLCFPCKRSGESFTVPESVLCIGSSAFCDCDGLETVVLPEKLAAISYCAFENCDKLDNVTLPQSVLNIGSYAFRNCGSLKSIAFSDNMTSFGEKVMEGTPWLEGMEDGPVYCGKVLGCIKGDASKLTEITVKDGTKCIAEYAFCTENGSAGRGNTALRSVVLPDSISHIGSYAFYGCSALTGVDMPEGAVSRGTGVFYGCSSLGDTVLSDSDTYISDMEYSKCDSLRDIVIPEGVKNIWQGAFAGCGSLSSVTVLDPDCRISGGPVTVCNEYAGDGSGEKAVFNGTICGYDGSAAEEYAKQCGYRFTSLGKSPKAYCLGDISDNGVVDAVDASMALSYYTKISAMADGGFNAGQRLAADVNGDGIIDAVDASKILSYYAYASTEEKTALSINEFLTGIIKIKSFDAEGRITSVIAGPDDKVLVCCGSDFKSPTFYVLDVKNDRLLRTIKATTQYQGLLGMFSDGTVAATGYDYSSDTERLFLYPSDSDIPFELEMDKSFVTRENMKMCTADDCIYVINNAEKCIMKINGKGEISRHLSLENHSGASWQNSDDGMFMVTEASSNSSGVRTCIYSVSDGSQVLSLPCSYGEMYLTSESYSLSYYLDNNAGMLLQTGSINGGIPDKAYKLPQEQFGYVLLGQDIKSDNLVAMKSCMDGYSDLLFFDVKNGKAAFTGVRTKGALYNSSCYLDSIGCWMIGVTTGDRLKDSSSLVMIDMDRLDFGVRLESTAVQEYRFKEHKDVGEAFRDIRLEADRVEQEFGVRILVGNEVKEAECSDWYTFGSTEENATEYTYSYEIERVLSLEKALASYPEGFFEHFRSENGECGLRISIVSDLKSDEYELFKAGGIAYTTGAWYDIAIPSDSVFERSSTIHHEIWHSVESLVQNHFGSIDDREWAGFNPDGFEYLYDMDEYAKNADGDSSIPIFFNSFTDGKPQYDYPYFISDYSLTTPMEDRATLIEFLLDWYYDANKDCMCLNDEEELKMFPHLRAKIEFLENWSKQEFGYIYWEKVRDNLMSPD